MAYPIVESEEMDPVTFQPIMSPDLDNPRPLRLFTQGWEYKFPGLIPTNRHFLGARYAMNVVRIGGLETFADDIRNH